MATGDAAAQSAGLLKLVAELLNALAPVLWPLIVVVLLWKLFPLVREIIRTRSFSVKVGNMEVSVQDATEQLRTQINDLQNQVIRLRDMKPEAEFPLVETAPEIVPAAHSRKGILWVDDKPEGNAFEIAQMESLGIEVITARTTAEGLRALGGARDVAAVISDMGRSEERGYRGEAGLELLQEIKAAGLDRPFMVYTGKRGAERANTSVRAAGGDGATASPVELLEWLRSRLGPPTPISTAS